MRFSISVDGFLRPRRLQRLEVDEVRGHYHFVKVTFSPTQVHDPQALRSLSTQLIFTACTMLVNQVVKIRTA